MMRTLIAKVILCGAPRFPVSVRGKMRRLNPKTAATTPVMRSNTQLTYIWSTHMVIT